MVMVGDTMKRLFPRLQQRYPWLVGRYFIGAFSGSPDDMWIYYYPDTGQRRAQCLTPEVEGGISSESDEPRLPTVRCIGWLDDGSQVSRDKSGPKTLDNDIGHEVADNSVRQSPAPE